MTDQPVDFKAWRLDLGLTQRQAALMVGVSRDVWQWVERGNRPQPRHQKAIAGFFQMRPTELWPRGNPQRKAA